MRVDNLANKKVLATKALEVSTTGHGLIFREGRDTAVFEGQRGDASP
jgi:hypothetical protein